MRLGSRNVVVTCYHRFIAALFLLTCTYASYLRTYSLRQTEPTVGASTALYSQRYETINVSSVLKDYE